MILFAARGAVAGTDRGSSNDKMIHLLPDLVHGVNAITGPAAPEVHVVWR
jgi:hypothetical protein